MVCGVGMSFRVCVLVLYVSAGQSTSCVTVLLFCIVSFPATALLPVLSCERYMFVMTRAVAVHCCEIANVICDCVIHVRRHANTAPTMQAAVRGCPDSPAVRCVHFPTLVCGCTVRAVHSVCIRMVLFVCKSLVGVRYICVIICDRRFPVTSSGAWSLVVESTAQQCSSCPSPTFPVSIIRGSRREGSRQLCTRRCHNRK